MSSDLLDPTAERHALPIFFDPSRRRWIGFLAMAGLLAMGGAVVIGALSVGIYNGPRLERVTLTQPQGGPLTPPAAEPAMIVAERPSEPVPDPAPAPTAAPPQAGTDAVEIAAIAVAAAPISLDVPTPRPRPAFSPPLPPEGPALRTLDHAPSIQVLSTSPLSWEAADASGVVGSRALTFFP